MQLLPAVTTQCTEKGELIHLFSCSHICIYMQLFKYKYCPFHIHQYSRFSTSIINHTCSHRPGWLFVGQHAKLFVRPAQLLYLSSCHSSGGVSVFGNSTKDGVFLHFNNHWYAYSRAASKFPGKPEPGYMIMR